MTDIKRDNRVIRLVDRDYEIFRELARWRVCLARHIKILVSMSSIRTTNRRIKKLIESGYISRVKILYGIPYIYTLEPKARSLIHFTNKPEKIRVDQVVHDIAVLDTAIYLNQVYGIPFSSMRTEKQLHSQDGFSNRKHQPDFVFNHKDKFVCVEVELSLKSKPRFEKNIEDNFSNYDMQYWFVPETIPKIKTILEEKEKFYPNIHIFKIEEVQKYVKSIS